MSIIKVWPNMRPIVRDKLRWLIDHTKEIERAHGLGGRRLTVHRPLLVYPCGKLRIEFVGTYASIDAACEHWQRLLPNTDEERDA